MLVWRIGRIGHRGVSAIGGLGRGSLVKRVAHEMKQLMDPPHIVTLVRTPRPRLYRPEMHMAATDRDSPG
jgi:hypothetical protein